MARVRKHALPGQTPTLAIADLSIAFGRRRESRPVVNSVALEVWPGEIVGLVGESGGGKTLTALAALRMLPRRARVLSGSIGLGATPLLDLSEREMRRVRGERLAFIPQDATQALNPTMRIGRQVGEPLELHRGASRREAAAAATGLLAAVQIREPETRVRNYPHQFSGGMQQRAMIAMGLALQPELLIADEPTTGLDVQTQAEVLRLLRGIRDSRETSILLITHNLGVVAELCDWVYVMREGSIVEDGPVEDILTAPRSTYTRTLLDAVLSLRPPRVVGAGR